MIKLISYIVGGYIILCVVVCVGYWVIKLVKALIARKRRKEEEERKKLGAEAYIPKSVLSSVFKCMNCGASVPAMTDNHLTMFCPFCGAKISEAKEIIDKAQESEQNDRDYNIEMKRLAEKERQQQIEQENIKLQQMRQKEHNNRKIRNYILAILSILLMFFMVLGAAGVLKF